MAKSRKKSPRKSVAGVRAGRPPARVKITGMTWQEAMKNSITKKPPAKG